MDNVNALIQFANEIGCETRLNQKLCDYTTFKIGGEVSAVFLPNNAQILSDLVKKANELCVDYVVIGNGSNLLFDDKGYHGVVIKIGNNMDSLTFLDDCTIKAFAGLPLSKLSTVACEKSLTGLEFSYGIPGTVGGAVFMNAGAYGGEIKDVIVNCETIDKFGKIKVYETNQMELSYRHSIFQNLDEIIISATFKLKKGEKSEISQKMRELMQRRKDKQPLEYPNAGSTFKRPEGQFAGKLIQDCNLRGFKVGGAMVSQKHCGFVINENNATFEDVSSLIKQVQEKVYDQTGFFLECEVKIIDY